jgi:hypothetical protein
VLKRRVDALGDERLAVSDRVACSAEIFELLAVCEDNRLPLVDLGRLGGEGCDGLLGVLLPQP